MGKLKELALGLLFKLLEKLADRYLSPERIKKISKEGIDKLLVTCDRFVTEYINKDGKVTAIEEVVLTIIENIKEARQ